MQRPPLYMGQVSMAFGELDLTTGGNFRRVADLHKCSYKFRDHSVFIVGDVRDLEGAGNISATAGIARYFQSGMVRVGHAPRLCGLILAGGKTLPREALENEASNSVSPLSNRI